MPNRILREGILTSDRIDQLDAAAEVFYRRLMSKVDDFGLHDARPSILRSFLFPLRADRVREADIARWIAACEKAGVIALYEHGGKPYLQMLDTEWQTRSEPKCPLPPWGKGKPLRAVASSCDQPVAPAPVFGGVAGDENPPKPPAEASGPSGDLEDWIPAEPWAEFIAMRKAKGKRAPFTDAARAGVVRELGKLRAAGHEPGAVLRQSVVNGWSGVFPLKGLRPVAAAVDATTVPSKAADKTAEYLAEQARVAAESKSPESEAARRAAMERLKGAKAA